MKAFILAAGVSRRLYPETYNMPKCLLDVGGKPIIDYQLEAIQNIGIKQVNTFLAASRVLQKIGIIKPSISIDNIVNDLVDTRYISKN